MAIYGYGYCDSGRRGFSVLGGNTIRVGGISCVVDFILFMCKVTVIGVTTATAFLFLDSSGDQYHLWTIVLIVCFFVLELLSFYCKSLNSDNYYFYFTNHIHSNFKEETNKNKT